MNLIQHFVGGELFSGSSDRIGKVFNPATGEQESEVKLAYKSDLDHAVEIAKKAFETWSLKPALQRAREAVKSGIPAIVNIWVDKEEFAPGTKNQTMYK